MGLLELFIYLQRDDRHGGGGVVVVVVVGGGGGGGVDVNFIIFCWTKLFVDIF